MVVDTVTDINKVVKEEDWNWTCPYCKGIEFAISPMDVVYRPHTYTDFNDLPISVRKYYRNLPIISKAISNLYNTPHRIDVECLKCGTHTKGFLNKRPNLCNENVIVRPDKNKLIKYVDNFYGVKYVMDLNRYDDE